jgi:cAMP phosphodiesterase
MILKRHILAAAFSFGYIFTLAQTSFEVVPLGVKGGSDESNLSAYLVGGVSDNAFVCVDAGTVHAGLEKAIVAGTLKGDVTTVLKENIKGYLISHPHLDHVAGLILNSPDDAPKPIYGLPFCLDVIKEKYFSWKSWANFGNEGEKPMLNKYRYTPLVSGQSTALEQTTLRVQAFELSHASPGQSTAFLLEQHGDYLLYLGDTGADEVEQSNKLAALWQQVGGLVKTKKLKAIFIEVSFSNEQPTKLLFGHLTPALLMKELAVLDKASGNSIAGLPIVITHMKPLNDREEKIKAELNSLNTLGVRLVFPLQGERLTF